VRRADPRRSAGFGWRFAALIYDGFLLLALLMIYTAGWIAFTPGHVAVTRQSAGLGYYLFGAGELVLIGGYYVGNWMRSGQTLGMRAWRLRTVTEDGNAMSLRSSLLRFLCGFLAWPPAALGVLWLYVDPERLAVHDRLSGTRVVRS
jgi:uncharacterized RDD family membrane protein YckC